MRRTLSTRLPPRSSPYYISVAKGVRLGLRVGLRASVWVGAIRNKAGKYENLTLGQYGSLTQADATRQLLGRQVEVVSGTVRSCVLNYVMAHEHTPYAHELMSICERDILPQLGSVRLDALTPARLLEWRNSLPNARRGIARANRIVSVLKAALNYAHTPHELKRFPCPTVARTRVLNPDEVRALLEAASPCMRTLVTIALLTGCRFGELAALRVKDLQGNYLLIAKSKAQRFRFVPLPPQALTILEQATHGRGANEPLLTRPNGTAWKNPQAHRDFIATQRRAGIERLTFHELRHTFATEMLRRTQNLHLVAQLLGHTSTRMTETHYLHLTQHDLAHAVSTFVLPTTAV